MHIIVCVTHIKVKPHSTGDFQALYRVLSMLIKKVYRLCAGQSLIVPAGNIPIDFLRGNPVAAAAALFISGYLLLPYERA